MKKNKCARASEEKGLMGNRKGGKAKGIQLTFIFVNFIVESHSCGRCKTITRHNFLAAVTLFEMIMMMIIIIIMSILNWQLNL